MKEKKLHLRAFTLRFFVQKPSTVSGAPDRFAIGRYRFVCRPDSKPIVRENVEYVYQSRERRPVSVNQAQSYSVHLMFAVFVLFLCNPLFGLIALIFAGVVC